MPTEQFQAENENGENKSSQINALPAASRNRHGGAEVYPELNARPRQGVTGLKRSSKNTNTLLALRNITNDDCECRYENAIFKQNESVFLIKGNLLDGYTVNTLSSIADLLKGEPDGWTNLEFQIQTELPSGIVYAGETSYGGAGFFAYKTAQGFEWVLHLDNMNNPVSISYNEGFIIGQVDEPYPNGSIFKIPIDHPEKFTVQNK